MHETAELLVQMTAVAIAMGILAQVLAERLRVPSAEDRLAAVFGRGSALEPQPAALS